MTNKTEKPLCKRCGEKTNKRGFETFATEPHKRRKYSCKVCGHTFTLPVKADPVSQEKTGGSTDVVTGSN